MGYSTCAKRVLLGGAGDDDLGRSLVRQRLCCDEIGTRCPMYDSWSVDDSTRVGVVRSYVV